jgi:hypothetical protein
VSGETIPVLFRMKQPGGTARVAIEIPVKTGDEGFRVLELMEKHHGSKERDAERDQRWLELQARIAKGAA